MVFHNTITIIVLLATLLKTPLMEVQQLEAPLEAHLELLHLELLHLETFLFLLLIIKEPITLVKFQKIVKPIMTKLVT